MTIEPLSGTVLVTRAAEAGALARTLARHVAQLLRQDLERRPRALLIVSGGSTPIPFLQALSSEPLPWSRVDATLADERWVPADHAQSNEALVRGHLLQGQAVLARFTPLFTGHALPAEGLAEIETRLAVLPWPATACVLGVGSDGHTASLFPGDSAWSAWWGGHGQISTPTSAARVLTVPAPSAPNIPVPRVSLSPSALRYAAVLIVHATGRAKQAVLARAQASNTVRDWPVALAWSMAPGELSHLPVCEWFISDD